MKKTFATLAAVLVTLCTASTAQAETPPPSGDAPAVTPAVVPQFYYSARSEMYAPTITSRQPDGLFAYWGQDVWFEFTYTGTPSPAIFVFRHGEPLDFSATDKKGNKIYFIEYDEGFCSFGIRTAIPEDSGEYRFQARNVLGTSSVTVKLTVPEY